MAPRGVKLGPMKPATPAQRRRARALWRERRRNRNALVRMRLKTAQPRWCFVHGGYAGWNDRRHQVTQVRCAYVRGEWWCMRGRKVARLGGRAYANEKTARRAALKHAKDHMRWIAAHRRRLAKQEKQIRRDIVRFSCVTR